MPSTILLRNIPEDVYKEIIKEQSRIKLDMGRSLSLDRTIVKMLKDYKKCKEQNNFKPSE